MSNDEYKNIFPNFNRFYFGQVITNNNKYSCSSSSSNSDDIYRTVFPAKESDPNTKSAVTTPSYQKLTFQSDDANDNNNNNKSNNHTNKSFVDSQFAPMNLITNTGLDLSHSIRKPTFTTYFNNESFNQNDNNNLYVLSPSSSTSASIDVENDDNDDSGDRIMSPVSIPSHQQTPLNDTRNPSQSAFKNMELTAGSIPSGFPLNYQLYANNAALYGAPVMFSGAIHAAHASYMAGLPLHAALSPNETYLKAIQAASCGIYSPTALAPPPPPPSTSSTASVNPSLFTSKPSTLHNPTGSSMMALAPSSQPMSISKSPQHHRQQYSPNFANSNIAEAEKQHKTPFSSQSTLRSSASSNSNGTGTYLNDKVNERLSSVNAIKDSHFKVPNGKEGSLKHRILRPPSNSDATSEQNKAPVMRTYSTTLNFKKGTYIELANGALRRVEDMRTEDFIQCAERSPHHQLAESTVVKINTSLPTTAVITFSYDRNRSKVDMEVSLDHPFFVYGQGWASCNPEMSVKMFGLKCQRLQVGDICISLSEREQAKQPTPPVSHAATHLNDAFNYQRRHTLTVSSPNAANIKSATLPTMSATTDMPYAASMNAPAFSIPIPQQNHNLQQQQQQHPHHAYAEMAKIVSSYAYANGLPQLPHEQLKDVVMDATILQNLTPKMMTAFYQNQILQIAQQQQHQHQHQQQQEHLRQTELKNIQQRVPNAHYNMATTFNSNLSPQPTDLKNNLSQQPPQTQPLDVTMSRKRRWSAPENMFDDEESDTQPPRNGLSPATART